MTQSLKIGFAITGASGIIYGLRTIEEIIKAEHTVYLTVSDSGKIVLKQELEIEFPENADDFFKEYFKTQNIKFYNQNDFFSPMASGSNAPDAMLIVPCSMKTVSSISTGYSKTLVERAFDVCLKEGKKTIILPRETPLNQIHLENLLKLSKMGVHIVPAMPGFYYKPQKIDDLVDFVVARILNLLNIKNDLLSPWGA